MSETVLYERVDRVAYVTLNRPEKLNAINTQLQTELLEHLDEAAADPSMPCRRRPGRRARLLCRLRPGWRRPIGPWSGRGPGLAGRRRAGLAANLGPPDSSDRSGSWTVPGRGHSAGVHLRRDHRGRRRPGRHRPASARGRLRRRLLDLAGRPQESQGDLSAQGDDRDRRRGRRDGAVQPDRPRRGAGR